MAIHSDAFQFDMSGWIDEKTSAALQHACSLVDWLDSAHEHLSSSDVEAVQEQLRPLVRYLSVLMTFASENRDIADLPKWQRALSAHGTDALQPFLRTVRGAGATSPPLIPAPVATALALLSELQTELALAAPERSIVRERIGQLPSLFTSPKLCSLRRAADRLAEFVDRQAVKNEVPWSEFQEAARPVVAELRAGCEAIADRYRLV
jgi:hypothetical protein